MTSHVQHRSGPSQRPRGTAGRALASLLVVGLMTAAPAGCDDRKMAPAAPASAAAAPAAAKVPAPAGDRARRELNAGYSLLYQQAVGIPKIEWLLMFKQQRPNLLPVTTELLDLYRRLSASLEKLAGQYPALRLDAETMPPVMAETRTAVGMDLAKDIAPLTGASGLPFERQLLLTFYYALDEQRHLVGVMIEREPEPGLKQFLQGIKDELEARRLAIGQLLERQYFRPASGPAPATRRKTTSP